MSDEDYLVPFGRYRGLSVDAMLADQAYVRWFVSQPDIMRMLREYHPVIFNIITTGTPASDHTPEHNRLQARFLDETFRLVVLGLLQERTHRGYQYKRIEFECGFDVRMETIREDVAVTDSHIYLTACNVFVECKPLVGDDYPAVLREIKRHEARPWLFDAHETIMLVEKFNADGATLEQVKAIYAPRHIILLSDVEDAIELEGSR